MLDDSEYQQKTMFVDYFNFLRPSSSFPRKTEFDFTLNKKINHNLTPLNKIINQNVCEIQCTYFLEKKIFEICRKKIIY